MARPMRYRDKVGFRALVETAPGVWSEEMIEKVYSGDVVKYSSHFSNNATVNTDIKLRNQISIVADAYLIDNHANLVYAWFFGTRWKVTAIEFSGKRLIIDLDGLYVVPEDEEDHYEEDEDDA